MAHTVEELEGAIKEYYPEGTNAEHNLMKLEMILRSRGTSLREVLEKASIPGSPFCKIASRQ